MQHPPTRPTAAPITLPEGWQPGDICGNCNMILLCHREGDFACPSSECSPGHKPHTETCWTYLRYRPDPISAARCSGKCCS